MQKYLNWKRLLVKYIKYKKKGDYFLTLQNIKYYNSNLFQYRYKYYNRLLQKQISSGFFFPNVEIQNVENYYLGKHFIVHNTINYFKDNLNKYLKKKKSIYKYNYNTAEPLNSSLNIFCTLCSIENVYSFYNFSNVMYFMDYDHTEVDLMDFVHFDYIGGSSEIFHIILFSNDVIYNNFSFEFLENKNTVAAHYIRTYKLFDFNSSILTETFISNSNNKVCYNNYVNYDYLHSYFFLNMRDKLKKNIKYKLQKRYTEKLEYLAELKIRIEEYLALIKEEIRIKSDKSIGDKQKERLIVELYNKQHDAETQRAEFKEKTSKEYRLTQIDLSNYTYLKPSLNDVNSLPINKFDYLSNLNNTNKIISNNIYQYEYENINNQISIYDQNTKSGIINSIADKISINNLNYYELNIQKPIDKELQLKQNKYNFEKYNKFFMDLLNGLLNYSELRNFDIENLYKSKNKFERLFSNRFKILKIMYNNYKLNTKFPIKYLYFSKFKKQTSNNISNNTILCYRKKNIYVKLLIPRINNLLYYPSSYFFDVKYNYYTYWDINCLYYKFLGFLIQHGKRHKAESILSNSFSFLKNLSLCNPLYLFMKAIYNGQTFFEFTKQKKQTKSILIPRFAPLNKRVRISMRLITQNIRDHDNLRKMKKLKKYKVSTSYLLSNILISYFFKIGKVKTDLKTNVTSAFKQKHLLRKNVGIFVYNRLLKFLAFRKIRGYHISK